MGIVLLYYNEVTQASSVCMKILTFHLDNNVILHPPKEIMKMGKEVHIDVCCLCRQDNLVSPNNWCPCDKILAI